MPSKAFRLTGDLKSRRAIPKGSFVFYKNNNVNAVLYKRSRNRFSSFRLNVDGVIESSSHLTLEQAVALREEVGAEDDVEMYETTKRTTLPEPGDVGTVSVTGMKRTRPEDSAESTDPVFRKKAKKTDEGKDENVLEGSDDTGAEAGASASKEPDKPEKVFGKRAKVDESDGPKVFGKDGDDDKEDAGAGASAEPGMDVDGEEEKKADAADGVKGVAEITGGASSKAPPKENAKGSKKMNETERLEAHIESIQAAIDDTLVAYLTTEGDTQSQAEGRLHKFEGMLKMKKKSLADLKAGRKALNKMESARLEKADAGDGLIEAQEEDNSVREDQANAHAAQHAAQMEGAMEVEGAAETKLAKGAFDGQTGVINANAGAVSGLPMTHAVDANTAAATIPKQGAVNNNPSTDDYDMGVAEGATLGDQIDGFQKPAVEQHQVNKATTSGNVMLHNDQNGPDVVRHLGKKYDPAADDIRMGTKHSTAMAKETERNQARQAKEAAKAESQRKKETAKAEAMHQAALPPVAHEDMEVGQGTTTRDILEHIQEGEADKVLDRLMSNLDSVGFELSPDQSAAVKQRDLIKKEIDAMLHVTSRQIDVQTMAAPTSSDILKGAVGKAVEQLTREGEIGDFPVFTPDDTLRKFTGLQSSENFHMTVKERDEILEAAKPWWNEYRTLRTNQAVVEMETMPTYLIKSPVGTVQVGSKVRKDITSVTDTFFQFMYWMMRDKLNYLGSMMDVKTMFTYAAAFGYNDLSRGQVNWLLTGDVNGSPMAADLGNLPFDTDAAEGDLVHMVGLSQFSKGELSYIQHVVKSNPFPSMPPPGKNVTPSAAPSHVAPSYFVENGRLVSSTSGRDDVERRTFAGLPNKVSNIPDPRFSERGGRQVPNVRIVTRPNPKYDPKHPDAEPKFITETEKPDVGAGAKDVNREVLKAEADRLMSSLPFKLYAPIHPQACDRYLGEKNYARLSQPPDKYFKSYVYQPIAVDQVIQQYNWNRLVMGAYGPMLYAFVTDASMQRSTPAFEMETPAAVTLEFMELNELIDELKRYQMKSADRADRVGDSGTARTPIEDHLEKFFHDRDEDIHEQIEDPNAMVIAIPDAPRDEDFNDDDDDDDDDGGDDKGGGEPLPPPGPGDNDNIAGPGRPHSDPMRRRDQTGDTTAILGMNSSGFKTNQRERPVTLGSVEINRGIRRETFSERSLAYKKSDSSYPVVNDVRHANEDVDRRSQMFKMFSRR